MRWLLVALALASAGCKQDAPEARPEDPAVVPSGAGIGPRNEARVEIVSALPGQDAAAIVKDELERAQRDGRELLVYVGAPWCEPCVRFHDAAAAGELDATFPGLRLVEFDLDQDKDRLDAAGYRSRLIPLFAVPRPDGRASGKQIEGSVKGDHAVGEITPRLRALLGR